MTIFEIYNRLKEQCELARDCINEVRKPEYTSSHVLMSIRELTIRQAFLGIFVEWEHFLEDSTIAYALGEESLLGFKPTKYIFPIDAEHAELLIKGNATYPDWSDFDSVKKIAMRLFENGEPYKGALDGFSSRFSEMKKIRNIIAHNSIKSKREFDTVVRNALRASAVGMRPTEFLLSKKNREPFFFDIYITHIENAAAKISNYSATASL